MAGPSEAFLKASLGLWRRRATYHHDKWLKLYHAKSADDAERRKQWHEWQDAIAEVNHRIEQIAALSPAYISGISVNLPPAIAAWEGGKGRDGLFHPYFDNDGGVWTIGYGHTNADGGLHVSADTKPLTQKEAETLLLHDLNVNYAPNVTKALRAAGWKGVSQKPYDGFVDFEYNLGPSYFDRGHNLGNAMYAHSITQCAAAVLIYDTAGGHVLPGLVKRRRWESQLVKGGTYTVNN